MSKERAAQLVDAGIWLKLSGDLEGARKLFERALKLDPESDKAKQLLSGTEGAAPPSAPSAQVVALEAPVPEVRQPPVPSTAPPAANPFEAPAASPPSPSHWSMATEKPAPAPIEPSLDGDWGRLTGAATPIPQPAPGTPVASVPAAPMSVVLGGESSDPALAPRPSRPTLSDWSTQVGGESSGQTISLGGFHSTPVTAATQRTPRPTLVEWAPPAQVRHPTAPILVASLEAPLLPAPPLVAPSPVPWPVDDEQRGAPADFSLTPTTSPAASPEPEMAGVLSGLSTTPADRPVVVLSAPTAPAPATEPAATVGHPTSLQSARADSSDAPVQPRRQPRPTMSDWGTQVGFDPSFEVEAAAAPAPVAVTPAVSPSAVTVPEMPVVASSGSPGAKAGVDLEVTARPRAPRPTLSDWGTQVGPIDGMAPLEVEAVSQPSALPHAATASRPTMVQWSGSSDSSAPMRPLFSAPPSSDAVTEPFVVPLAPDEAPATQPFEVAATVRPPPAGPNVATTGEAAPREPQSSSPAAPGVSAPHVEASPADAPPVAPPFPSEPPRSFTEPMGYAWGWSSSTPAPEALEAPPVPRPSPSLAPAAESAWDARSNPGIKLEAVVGRDKALDLISSDSKITRPPPTTKDEVAAILRGARDLLELDDHTGAMELINKAQAIAPDDPEVISMREKSEKTLVTMFESKLGKLEAVPRVLLKEDEIIWLNLDHRAGFVLAQIDGTVSFDDLFSVSGMSRIDTARILAQLVEEGVISRG